MQESQLEKVRKRAEEDLAYFAQLVQPNRSYGDIHLELFEWWTRHTAMDCQLVLLPRDHQKSHCSAVRCAWELTRDPTSTHLYISATEKLAVRQLYAIKNILTSSVYRRYWPDMIREEEGKREKWTTTEIIVDHPKRKVAGERDASITAAGITANVTGLHCTYNWLDDVVVPTNAYTIEGRDSVDSLYSQLASVESTGAKEIVVGTRYHPGDLYQTMLDMEEEDFDDDMELIGQRKVYEVFERVVEEEGIFLWPKKFNEMVGKPFGFDARELARKKAKYIDTTQFFAQYYNNPNDPSMDRIDRSKFQYYDQKFLKYDGYWNFRKERLNVYAAIDFAFSLNKKADYTAIVVIGMNKHRNIYLLDIDRFKSDKISIYYKHLLDLHTKWGFRKIRAEVVAAQAVIVKDLKENYIVPNGLALSVDEFRPTRTLGSKEERIAATLEPRYDNQSIFHYKGGLTNALEEELVLANPPHDDIKDTLAAAVDIAIPPTFSRKKKDASVIFHPRFGGVAYSNRMN